ncbi:hypothetical protein B7P43_G10213 [Cryptotermes secundus]|uniref:Uncharacterized protein n=1 Tax=Cryptotermes secundus TaxID=105785 RepID=A0A2J7QYX0_9NEOP|nr:hypothetical protein B7P43_G10213 [Cryptotermes secundus]
MWVCSLRSTRNEPMLIPMLHLSMISEIMHMREVVALLGPFLLWPQELMTTSKTSIILEHGGHGLTSWQTCMGKKGRRVKRNSRKIKKEQLCVLGSPRITQHTHTHIEPHTFLYGE